MTRCGATAGRQGLAAQQPWSCNEGWRRTGGCGWEGRVWAGVGRRRDEVGAKTTVKAIVVRGGWSGLKAEDVQGG